MQTFAVDRVQLIQSKIQSSLGSVLPKSDFLVVVNRLDSLNDGGASQVVDGALKMLPGLNLGIDSKGEIIAQGNSGVNYNGAVSILVIVDKQIKNETYKAIEKLMPEIVGGLRDNDEMKLSQAPLRQPDLKKNDSPQISIQNMMDNKNQMQENIKFLALLLLTGGLFFWFMNRLSHSQQPREAEPPTAKHSETHTNQDDEHNLLHVNASDFLVLDPATVALFLLKEVKDKKIDSWKKWIKSAPVIHQREVFKRLPSWVLSYLQDMRKKNSSKDSEDAKISLHDLFNNMSMVEQSFKTEAQKQKAFLQWFPAESLRFVSQRHQKSFSEKSKKILWSIRPDLGNFVKVDTLEVTELLKDASNSDIALCFEELHQLPSLDIEENISADDAVERWAGLINQLKEFGAIDSQLAQAQNKLPDYEYLRLAHSVANINTPFEFSTSQRKDWLRAIVPEDYYYWLQSVKKVPTWNLETDLRPMRLAMFQDAEKAAHHKLWSEENRKISAERILISLRLVKTQSAAVNVYDAA